MRAHCSHFPFKFGPWMLYISRQLNLSARKNRSCNWRATTSGYWPLQRFSGSRSGARVRLRRSAMPAIQNRNSTYRFPLRAPRIPGPYGCRGYRIMGGERSHMATEKQIAANRANAKRSTGPRTLAGKTISSRNACRHGLSNSLRLDPLTSAKIDASLSQ